jgi:acyl-CoA thioesterase I
MIKKIITVLILSFILVGCGKAEVISEVQNDKQEIVQKNILALWDSITAGYNLELSDAYPAELEELMQKQGYNYKIVNAWVSGDTSKNLLDRIELYDDLEVDIYMLTIWWNDWLRRQSVDTMKQNISAIIEHLETVNPEGKIILSGMQMPINLWLNYSREFNKSYEILADKYNLALYDFFLEWVAKDTNLNLSDGIHPNNAGYKIIAANLFEFLEDEDIIQK